MWHDRVGPSPRSCHDVTPLHPLLCQNRCDPPQADRPTGACIPRMNQANTPQPDTASASASGPASGSALPVSPAISTAAALLAEAEPGSLLATVLASLDDDQAQEVISIPLAGKSTIADHMVIASGRSTRQVAAMAQKLAERVKKDGFGHCRIEGLPAADWVLIDAGDVIVHLFRPEVRAFYNLERMWTFNSDAPVAA